jgi:pimeloyl-ACP methyl ester carboxylesterase
MRIRPAARLLLACGALAIVLVAGCSPAPSPTTALLPSTPPGSASPTTSASPPAPSIAPARWSDCGGGFQCTTLSMPLDYTTGDGVMNLSLVRLLATDQNARIGSLLINPGGPGGSGVEFLRTGVQFFPKALRRRFDLVGFDPRGVNQSTGIRCVDDLDSRANVDPNPDDPAELRALVTDARTYAEACAKRNAAVLPYLSTEDVVRDLDAIRTSLDEDRITYLGFSYGTLIGAMYADRYPDHVRAMVLDGALDPALSLAQVRTGQAKGFETELDRFLAACGRRRDCLLGRGAAVRRNFDALMRRIDAHPLPSSRAEDSRKVGPGLAWSAVLGALYSRDAWPALELSLGFARQGDGSLLLAISDPYRGRKPNGTYSNMLDAFTANTCLDFPAPTDTGDYTALAKHLVSVSQHFGSFAAYGDLACAFWPVRAVRQPGPVKGAGAPPIVVIGTTNDPATPMPWARSLAAELESGVLVTHIGDGHTAYAASGCVRDLVTRYLVSVKPPPAGTVCN